MSKIAVEYHGFLKFINYAESRIINWFGPHCNYEPTQIISMSARDWDGMADEERLYFIREHYLDSSMWKDKLPLSKNTFFSFLLDKSFNNLETEKPFYRSPSQYNSSKNLSREYSKLPKEEIQKYANLSIPRLGMERVLERRDKLHKMFTPKELNKLEYIIKTSPKQPISSRSWFLMLKNVSLNPLQGHSTWEDLSVEQKSFYEDCQKIDRKRYRFERNIWLTKLAQIDWDNQVWTIEDFQLRQTKPHLEALNTIIELNKDRIPTSVRAKKPPSAFALYLKDCHSKQKLSDNKENFKLIAESWSQLPEEERQKYFAARKQLFESYKQRSNTDEDGTDLYSLSGSLFRHVKNLTGPTRPSHLISYKLKSVENYYGKLKGIPRKQRLDTWNSLPEREKKFYITEYEKLKSISKLETEQLDEKIKSLTQTIEKANELKKTKQNLGLIKISRKISKRLYPELNVD